MAPPLTVVTTSSYSLLLIYRPRKDERLSWPSWLTYSGRFTHISGHPSAVGRAQDSESSPVKDPTFYHWATEPTGWIHPWRRDIILITGNSQKALYDLILTYNSFFWAHWYTVSDFFTFADRTHNTNIYKLLPSHCRVDVRKYVSSLDRVLKPWNSLPAELHHFTSLSVFKSFIFNVNLYKFVIF